MKWSVVKYLFFGVSLYAVENYSGEIHCYCDDKKTATEKAKNLNNAI